MYNLDLHYQNLYQYLTTIIADPRLGYLHPFGSTQPENLEIIRNDNLPEEISNLVQYNPDTLPLTLDRRGPLFIFQDQEPLDAEYNKPLFDWIQNNTMGPYVLVNTERNSTDGDIICERYPYAKVDYFFHIFAAADWFRGHQFLPGIIPVKDRVLKKSYISFNRLTSNRRIYRSLLVNELYKNDILNNGYVSYSHHCPDDGAFDENLRKGVPEYTFDPAYIEEAITNINQIPELRIDFPGQQIPNQSMMLSPLPQLMESFIFLVTETCFFQTKTHLTEKIFKPIVLRMPFILAGCAHNLEYLRSYGFKTFGDYWDESYDTIEDPVKRIEAIAKILKDISSLSLEQQKSMLLDMLPILEHNYNLFNGDLVKNEWDHITGQLKEICKLYEFKPPYKLNTRLGQAIPVSPK